MKISKYKQIILEVLRKNPVHPNVNELYLMVKREYPNIGIATIYRNLESLVESGDIISFKTSENYMRYDATVKEHYHMICAKCGKVYDLSKDVVKVNYDKINAMTGHIIKEHRLTFVGICRNCKDKQ